MFFNIVLFYYILIVSAANYNPYEECYDCREYYCGVDAITKTISFLTSFGCPRDSCKNFLIVSKKQII